MLSAKRLRNGYSNTSFRRLAWLSRADLGKSSSSLHREEKGREGKGAIQCRSIFFFRTSRHDHRVPFAKQRCGRPKCHSISEKIDPMRQKHLPVRIHRALQRLAVIRHAIALGTCRTRTSFLNLSSVCAEPVLAFHHFHVQMAQKKVVSFLPTP